MPVMGAFEKARVYIETHSKISEDLEQRKKKLHPGPCITISREAGAGASVISKKLVEYFQSYSSKGSMPWTFFDKNLIEKILADHHLPGKLKEFLKEDKLSELKTTMNELFGLHPSRWILIHKTIETILQLASSGNVVIVGRGGNIITAKLKNAFHVRLVAPLEDRIKHVEHLYSFNRYEATHYVKKEDLARAKYFMTNFHKDITDPLLYHLVLNTAELGYDLTVYIIAETIKKNFHYMFKKLEHNSAYL